LKELHGKIEEEIAKTGVIPFARFMELALYCPVYGFYEKEGDSIGKRGDYYTSVSVGSLFGELLGRQFADWFLEHENHSKPAAETGLPLQIIEAGAHQGDLARDLLAFLREAYPPLFSRLEYWIVEPSIRRSEWQRRKLPEWSNKVRWAARLEDVPRADPVKTSPGMRIIFSNELLDAMPVRRFEWDARQQSWFEWGVGFCSGRFVWRQMPGRHTTGDLLPDFPGPQSRFAEETIPSPSLDEVFPNGFVLEICAAALEWWNKAARNLGTGKLMTIDYGHGAREPFTPGEGPGTLRAYRSHRISDDVLADPGSQDITAHVNFAALQRAGELNGLQTETFCTQEYFLTEIAARRCCDHGRFAEWTPERIRQFKTLIHPEHLGQAFKVLVQSSRTSLTACPPPG
jgi:SAM-dependent MidA family methyltransferase